jgi:membrane protein YqaA with SNARE-associated domain
MARRPCCSPRAASLLSHWSGQIVPATEAASPRIGTAQRQAEAFLTTSERTVALRHKSWSRENGGGGRSPRGETPLEKSLSFAGRWWRYLAVGVVVALLLALVLARPDLSTLSHYGYPGIYVMMLLSSATVLLPAPGMAFVLAASTFWNPLAVGIAAGLGAATGELTGYIIGYGGRDALEGRYAKLMHRFEGWLRKYGLVALFAMAVIPNPVFDVVGLAAGSLGYPVWKFLLAVGAGNLIKYVAVSLLGGGVASMLLGG